MFLSGAAPSYLYVVLVRKGASHASLWEWLALRAAEACMACSDPSRIVAAPVFNPYKAVDQKLLTVAERLQYEGYQRCLQPA